ncbi:MAG: glycosyltransferase family 2 protein [Pseudomonadota bacterium]|nr:glycosyltransferase family 2 protein [Pseudomonadota bacterium]
MIHGKRVHVVLPAYNAARTLAATLAAIPPGVVDAVLLVDDASTDDTVLTARALGVETRVHPANRGYGANQKTCYRAALDAGADVVVMLHPDGQYDPRLVPAMASLVALGQYDLVLGSRVLGRGARHGGMPWWRLVGNHALTTLENVLLDRALAEWHSGYRAWSRAALTAIPFERNADDFVFDNEVLVQAVHLGLEIGEVACPARYTAESSSISAPRAARYAGGVVRAAVTYRLQRMGLVRSRLLDGLPPGE